MIMANLLGAEMIDHDGVRRIALALPDVVEGDEILGFSVMNRGKYKGIAWLWKERVEPKKPKVANEGVLAVRVDGAATKAELLASDPAVFFTEDHYNGYPAVLVRLAEVSEEELRELLTDAWRVQAPKSLVRDSGL
jgi:hypothetical protein